MRGLIICGYPGIGKSSIAGWNNCVDLDSSLYSSIDGADVPDFVWTLRYCDAVVSLAEQGFTVLVSTHKEVRETLKAMTDIPIAVICPEMDRKEEWVEMLFKRYEESNLDKDLAAADRAENHWEDDISDIMNDYDNIPVWMLKRGQDLRKVIYNIQYELIKDDVVSPLHMLNYSLNFVSSLYADPTQYAKGLKEGLTYAKDLLDGKRPDLVVQNYIFKKEKLK